MKQFNNIININISYTTFDLLNVRAICTFDSIISVTTKGELVRKCLLQYYMYTWMKLACQ